MRHAGTEEDKVSLLLKRNFLIRKQQDEVTADQDVEGLNRIPGRPFRTGFSLCMRIPLQLQLPGSQGVLFPRHEVTEKPATRVLRSLVDVAGNRCRCI